MNQGSANHNVAGTAYALGAYLMWGFFPVFWKALGHVPALEILFQRVIWSALFLAGMVTLTRGWRQVRALLRTPRQMALLTATTALIGVNWLIFIWAVNADRVLETSLGYFINPLVNVVLGVLFLGERLRRWQTLAVLLAAAGVLNLTAATGVPPWIALTLAVTFGLYGLLRKISPVEPLVGLLVETGIMMPVALAYVLWLQATGTGSFGLDWGTDALLILGGAVTMAPMIMFNAAARRLRYATLGVLQYLAPSLHFILAVHLYGEPLTAAHLVTFACIWTGIALFAGDAVRAGRSRRLSRAVSGE